jgi:hypothetical protein
MSRKRPTTRPPKRPAVPAKSPAPRPPEPFEQLRTEREAAAILGLTIKTLQKRRVEGRPPEFIKLGDSKRSPVRYADSVLRRLIESGQRTSTSENPR